MSREKVGMVLAEFFGTAILASLVLAQVNAVGAILSSPWYIAATAGLTLAVLVLSFGRVSGGHFNPGVTVGLWSVGKTPTTTAVVYVAAQMLGGLCALMLFQFLTNTTVGNIAGSFDWRIFTAEMVGSFLFMHGIAAAVFQGFSGLKAAWLIGTSLTLGVILAAVASNGILNPAVAVGLNSWSWTYALAPVFGGLLAFNFYTLFFSDEHALVKKMSSSKASSKKRK